MKINDINTDIDRNYWNNVKGVLIMLVVLGHVIQVFFEKEGSETHYILQGILCFIYYFHMPLFVFISGYFSKNVKKRRNKAFEDLLIPYFLAQILWMIYQAIFKHSFGVVKNIFYPQFAMWYLLALFIWRILLPDLIRIKGILPISAFLFIAGMFCTGINNNFALQRTVGFLLFFMLGYYSSKKEITKICKIPFILCWGCIIMSLFGSVLIFWKKLLSFETLFYTLTHSKYITSYVSVWRGVVIYAIVLMIAIVLSCCVLRLIMNKYCWFTKIGEDTLPLYITHGFTVHAFLSVYSKIKITYSFIHGLILVFVALIIITVFSCNKYRNLFNKVLHAIKNICFKKF